ncbi:MAG: phosphotransferase [Clostridia bacterium]|nr:phosphotransferase [Clostridia bacterium]
MDELKNKENQYKSIDLSQWHKTGSGANSDSYVNEDETLLLKHFKFHGTEELALNDYNMAKKVAGLGIATASVYEVVRIGDEYGVIYENIRHKKSYSRMVADNPEKLDEYAKSFARKTKELHSTPCDTQLFGSKTDRIRTGIEAAKFIGKYKAGLYKLLEEMDEHTTCLHGDLQTGNLIQAEGKDYWIDLDRFSSGDPLMDLAHMYNAFVDMAWLPYIPYLMHMNKKKLNRFWAVFVKEYFGYNEEETKALNKKLDIYNALDLLQKNNKPGWYPDLITLILVKPKLKRFFK